MSKKFHLFLIMFTLGFFLLPGLTYACGTSKEKECCKKEVNSKTSKKKCCKESQSDNREKNCGGKCGHSNCTFSSVSLPLLPVNDVDFKANNFNFLSEKQKFYHSVTFISPGFTTVWLPPEIA